MPTHSDDSTFPPEPKSKNPKARRRKPDEAGFRRGYHGYTVMPSMTRGMTRLFKSEYAKKTLPGLPESVWWPKLNDWDGCCACIDAMLSQDLGALFELTLAFPEHTFGFEAMLKSHNRNEEVSERVVLRSQPLPREHRLDVEAVRLYSGIVELRAVIRRDGENKTVAQECLWRGTLDAALASRRVTATTFENPALTESNP